MELPQSILTSELFGRVVIIISAVIGLLVVWLVILLLMHTVYMFGHTKTMLYRKQAPVEGWSRRFYPACLIMIIGLLMLLWLLNAWQHSQTTI